MHVRESGPAGAPAVLLLHGQMLDGSIYDALAPRLARRFCVLVPDLPGYGRTPLFSPYSFAGVRAAIEDALAARGVREAQVVGFSLGGYHAIALALAGRVAVRRLALLAPIAGADAPLRETFAAYARAVRGGMKVGAPFAQMAIPPAYGAAHPDLAPRIAAAADAVPPATYVAEFEAIAALEDLRPRLGELRAPTLVRVGDADQNVPPALVEPLAAAIPGARLDVVRGCGHLYLEQDAQPTIASVERFLA